MEIKIIETQTTKLLKDMEKNSLVTFGLNAPQTVEIEGNIFTARPFDCYNWKIVLDGEKVIINPAFYEGDLKEVTVEGELWIFYNTDKALLYDNTNGVFVGIVSEDLDPLTHAERVQLYLDEKEKGEI